MERYAKGDRCRRRALLGYFGERIPRCAGCDICGRRSDRAVPNPGLERRLARLRLALGTRGTPWGGCLLEPDVLRRVSELAPMSEAELARIDGVGVVLATQYGKTILEALR
jgi:superfamily II DNA helicase RecQ